LKKAFYYLQELINDYEKTGEFTGTTQKKSAVHPEQLRGRDEGFFKLQGSSKYWRNYLKLSVQIE